MYTTKNFIHFSFLALALCALVLGGCKSEPEPEPDACEVANENHQWSYDAVGGPECWGGVCHGSTCGGSAQSPINVIGADTSTTAPFLSPVGGITKTNIENNGHTIKFNLEPGTFMSYGTLPNGFSNEATLGQFHFHANSEHQIAGAYSDLEVHMVHRSIWEDNYYVISIMIEEGAENTFLNKFSGNFPTVENTSYVEDALTFNPYDLLPTDRSYYKYSGSLTTPPCSEVVTWIIMENPIEASTAQITELTDILGSNYRPVQELNGRNIEYVVN